MLLKEDFMLNYINYKFQIKFKQEKDFILPSARNPFQTMIFHHPYLSNELSTLCSLAGLLFECIFKIRQWHRVVLPDTKVKASRN